MIALHFLAFKVAAFLYVRTHDLPLVYIASFPVVNYPLVQGAWWCVFVFFGMLLPVSLVWFYDYAVGKFFSAGKSAR